MYIHSPGTENVVMGDMQRLLRRHGNDVWGGERSWLTGTSSANQRVEYWWAFLRKQCVQFWMEIFHELQDEGLYDGGHLDKNLAQFCFLGLVQVRM